MSRPDDLAIIDAALRGEDDGSELASLVADVRASAPRMSPALERRLDEVGGGRPPAAARRRRWWLLAPAGGVAALVAGVVAVSMTGSGGDEVSQFTARPTSGGAPQTAPAQHAPPSHAEGASGAATAQSPRLA